MGRKMLVDVEQLREFVEKIFDEKRMKWMIEEVHATYQLLYGYPLPKQLLEILKEVYDGKVGTKT